MQTKDRKNLNLEDGRYRRLVRSQKSGQNHVMQLWIECNVNGSSRSFNYEIRQNYQLPDGRTARSAMLESGKAESTQEAAQLNGNATMDRLLKS